MKSPVNRDDDVVVCGGSGEACTSCVLLLSFFMTLLLHNVDDENATNGAVDDTLLDLLAVLINISLDLDNERDAFVAILVGLDADVKGFLDEEKFTLLIVVVEISVVAANALNDIENDNLVA
eukprot:CAMPEP_0194442150 /NCGR_PEP_ID=MMETSP0176-20130528/125286_1 /TAXON_ID=216777 /ORGANISM="Proboscia alata, Strain PI-D3" /LENGTH=121 /DNA_ID=CAMNT_0039268083 /DNA_START=152 /DNA_END=517 /DNA_ORIENTATION=+